MEGGQWQRDRKWSPGYGGKGGFSTFLYLCNQREEKFLWLFLRMVCSQDLEHLFHQQPLASFPGATRTTIPVDWRNSARQSLRLCWHCFVPSPLQGNWPCCPHPPTVQLHLSRCHPPAWCPSAPCSQASLCPPMGPPLGAAPVCELGLCASKSTREWGSKFGTRSLLGRRQALLCSPLLYQDGPTLISAGFLHSASEHCVFPSGCCAL